MINKIKEINIVSATRNLINWRLLKQKVQDGLTRFPTQQLMLETYVITKDGKIRDHKKGKAHSYTIQWLQHIELMTNHSFNTTSGLVYIRDTNNTVQNMYQNGTWAGNWFMAMGAPATNTNYGILVGSGSTAVACSDYKIQTLIAHGSGSGQLNYSATVVVGATNAGTTCSLAITRAFSNAYSSDVTINEIGLACESSNASQYYFLVVHDLATQVLHAGDTYLVIYTMQTSISS
jgi:hypothetical protein